MSITLIVSIIAVLANIVTIILGLREIRSLKSKCKNLESQVAQMSNNLYHSSLEVINGNKIYQGIDTNQIEELMLKIHNNQQEDFVRQEDFLCLLEYFYKLADIQGELVNIIRQGVKRMNTRLDKWINKLS